MTVLVCKWREDHAPTLHVPGMHLSHVCMSQYIHNRLDTSIYNKYDLQKGVLEQSHQVWWCPPQLGTATAQSQAGSQWQPGAEQCCLGGPSAPVGAAAN